MTLVKKLLISTFVASLSFSALAAATDKQVIELKDGTMLHVYKDGKMAMEDKYGRPVRMEEGKEMETKDGKKFVMKGDEVAKLASELRKSGGGNGGGHGGH